MAGDSVNDPADQGVRASGNSRVVFNGSCRSINLPVYSLRSILPVLDFNGSLPAGRQGPIKKFSSGYPQNLVIGCIKIGLEILDMYQLGAILVL